MDNVSKGFQNTPERKEIYGVFKVRSKSVCGGVLVWPVLGKGAWFQWIGVYLSHQGEDLVNIGRVVIISYRYKLFYVSFQSQVEL